MLYVIESSDDGRIHSAKECDNGIDEAIEYIANMLSHPEEDWTAACDVIAEKWNDTVEEAAYVDADAHKMFSMSRSGYHNFGLVTIP
jgi:hypothetical protein